MVQWFTLRVSVEKVPASIPDRAYFGKTIFSKLIPSVINGATGVISKVGYSQYREFSQFAAWYLMWLCGT